MTSIDVARKKERKKCVFSHWIFLEGAPSIDFCSMFSSFKRF